MGSADPLLAGPFLRRSERSRACVWLATDGPVEVSAEVVGLEAGRRATVYGRGTSRSVRLGERLHVHLVEVTPEAEAFPTGELLGYDVVVDGRSLADLGRLSGETSIAYRDLALPSFFLPDPGRPLRVLHGSCRLLHGLGEDAFAVADEVLSRSASELADRPSALILTGDQIYGDQVAGPLVGEMARLRGDLVGAADDRSVPGLPPLSTIPVYGRQELVVDRARLTSGKAANHLISFGEFAAMYLLAWDEGRWPASFPDAETAVPADQGSEREVRRLRKQYRTELANLEQVRTALPRIRRAMANVPTYMAFDDHDVTDDWNLTGEWCRDVRASPAGRRVVANALASFWAFQGWGNDPGEHNDEVATVVAAHVTGDGGDAGEPGDRFDETLWNHDRWSFAVPTDPPVVVLDTRAQRAFDTDEGAARLIGPSERRRVADLVRAAGHHAGSPVVFVSAVPMFGLELQERRQKFLVGKVGPYEIDFEAWHSNLAGLVDVMGLLIDDLELRRCVVLSGDVHYGINVRATFSIDDRELVVAQLVSSSQKHSGATTRVGIDLIGRLVRSRHERLGWDEPPPVRGRQAVLERLVHRPVNTDAWTEDSPVFLSPASAGQVDGDEPRYRETRTYLRPSGGRSVLVGRNNMGLASIDGDEVRHDLLTLGPDGTEVRTVTISLDDS